MADAFPAGSADVDLPETPGAEGMSRALDKETYEAVARLLSEADPDDLPRRAHRIRYPGDPNRRATRLPAIFMAWLQWRCLDVDGEGQVAALSRFASPWLAHGAATRLPDGVDRDRGHLMPSSADPKASPPGRRTGPSTLRALA